MINTIGFRVIRLQWRTVCSASRRKNVDVAPSGEFGVYGTPPPTGVTGVPARKMFLNSVLTDNLYGYF